jgi:hypothetical protein
MKNILFIDFFKYKNLYNSIINNLKNDYDIKYKIATYSDIENRQIYDINEYSIIIYFCEDDDKIVNIIKSYNIPLVNKLTSLNEIIELIKKHFNKNITYLKRYNKKKFIKSNLIKNNSDIINDEIIIKKEFVIPKFDKIILFIDYERNKIIYNEILNKLQKKNINIEFDTISSKKMIEYHQKGKYIINLNKTFVGIFISDDITDLQEVFTLYDIPLLTNKMSLNDIIENIILLYNKYNTDILELKDYLKIDNTNKIKKKLTNKIIDRKMKKLVLLKNYTS